MKPNLFTLAYLRRNIMPLGCFILATSSLPTLAADYTWIQDSAASNAWATTSNWADINADTVGDVFPANPTTGHNLTFFSNTTTALTAGTNTIGSAGAELLPNSLTLNGKGADSGSATIINFTGGQTWAVNNFVAARAIVNLDAMAGTQGLSYTINPTLKVYDDEGMDFNGNGTASFMFNSFNMDAGFYTKNVVKNGTSALTLNFLSTGARGDILSAGGGALTITGTMGNGSTRSPKVIANGGVINWNAGGNFGGIGVGLGVEGATTTFNYQGGSASYNGGLNLQAIFVGANSGQTGTMNVTGGTIGFTGNGNVWIGADGYDGNTDFDGTAVMNISGTGTIDTGTLVEDFRIGSNLGGSTGSGTLNLNTGGTLATARTITFGDNDVTKSVMNFNGGTLKANATTATLSASNGRVNIRNGGAIVDTNNFNITIARVLEHSNIGVDNATDGGLTKSGLGTLSLTGANTYTGATNVNAGTLALGTGGSIAGSSSIKVATDATFDVSAVSGGWSLGSGKSLGGDGAVTGPATFSEGSIFGWNLSVTTPANTGSATVADTLAVSGNLVDGGAIGGSVFKILLAGSQTFADNFWSVNQSWSNVLTSSNSLALETLFTSFSYENVSGAISPTGFGSFTLTGSTLFYTAVPEPTSALAGLLLGAGLLRRRRTA